MRDHEAIVIKEFNGFFDRGDAYDVPIDHWSDCNNVQFTEGFRTRDGFNVREPGITDVLKVYNYPKVDSYSLLILDVNGNIYDTGSPTPLVPILSIPGMLDFGLAIVNGRAYISPSTTVHGMASEFLYVYSGDGSTARKAAGEPPVDADGVMTAANSATAGTVEAGIHIFGVVYETDTGFDTQIGPETLAELTATGGFKVDLASIPVSPNSYVVNKRIVATRAIDPALYTGNTRGYQFFFIPGATIANATTTLTVDFYDVELLADASHLLDLYTEIPAGVGLATYGSRLVLYTLNDDDEQSTILVSYPGEPEAFDQVSGILSLETDHQPITICREFRDVLYIFKYVKTFAVSDNGDLPSTWKIIPLDQGLGASLHGIATVLDTGGVSVDYLIVTNYSGVYLFSGSFQFPELSYKIANFWTSFNFSDFQRTEIYNDSILKRIYIILPDLQQFLLGDYQHGLDPVKIRWAKWTADFQFTSMCLTEFNTLIVGARELNP
jgi:hypothetical protein